jgi:hypothetical protein
MSLGGAGAAGHGPDTAGPTVVSPGSDGALDAMLDHIATELAIEYVDRMEGAAKPSGASEIDQSSEGIE